MCHNGNATTVAGISMISNHSNSRRHCTAAVMADSRAPKPAERDVVVGHHSVTSME